MRIIAQTERLTIRTFIPSDEDPYIAMMLDPIVNQHLPKRTEEEHRRMFRESLEQDTPLNRWAIAAAGDNTFAGMCLLRQFNPDDAQTLELGYSLPVEYWGKGLATQMAGLLIDYARNLPQVRKLVAVTTLGNIASQNVLQKAGFTAQGGIERGGEMLAYFELEWSA